MSYSKGGYDVETYSKLRSLSNYKSSQSLVVISMTS